MTCRIFNVLLLFICIHSPVRAGHSTVSTPLATMPSTAQWTAVNQAELGKLAAMKQLLAWQLGQRQKLYQRGNASWWELRQAEATLEMVEIEIQGRQRLAQTLQSPKLQAVEAPRSTSVLKSFTAVTANGARSPRTVAWMVSNQLNTEAHVAPAGDAERLGQELQMLTEQIERLARAVARTDTPPSAHREFARLRLHVLRAEQQCVQLQLKIQRREDDPSLSHNSEASSWWIAFTAAADERLRSATCQVIQAELSSEAAIQAARLELQLAKQQHDAIQRLANRGHTAPGELKQAQADLHDALTDLDQRVAYRTALKMQLDSLADQSTNTTDLGLDPLTTDQLRPVLLNDPVATRFLARLHVQQAYAEIAALRQRAKGKMLTDKHHRLSQIRLTSERHDRELRQLADHIALAEARSNRLAQQARICQLERDRFTIQMAVQHRLLTLASEPDLFPKSKHIVKSDALESAWLLTSMITQDGSGGPLQVPASSRRLGGIAYLESFQWCDDLRDAEFRDRSFESLRLGVEKFEPRALRRVRRRRGSSGISTWTRVDSIGSRRLQISGDRLSSLLDDERRSHRYPRTTVPRYSDYYAFGIRRTDAPGGRPRANAYGGPWYLPGSPTNFRD